MNRSTIFTNSAGSVAPCKVHQQKSRMNLGSRLRSNETSKKGWGWAFYGGNRQQNLSFYKLNLSDYMITCAISVFAPNFVASVLSGNSAFPLEER